MAGLKGLNKSDRTAQDINVDQFIRGAQERVVGLTQKIVKNEKTFQRYTFSLTSEVSVKIDQISLIPRHFRSSRSDVIKAAVELLIELPENEIIAALDKVK